MGDGPAVIEQKNNRKRKKRRGLKVFGVLFLLFSLALLSVGLWFYAKDGRAILSYYQKAKSIMREASAEDFKKSRTSIIYATDGTVIKALQSGKDVYYLPYTDIPESVVTAMIVTEDKKFFSHEGVDYMANMIRAAVGDPCDFTSTGGSAVATRLLALTPGTVKTVPNMQQYAASDVVIEHHLNPGDKINEYHTNLDGCGYVVCTADNAEKAAQKAESIKNQIDSGIVRS